MTLTFTLTDTEYVAVMKALSVAARRSRHDYRLTYISETDKLELLHLRTLLAEASIKEESL